MQAKMGTGLTYRHEDGMNWHHILPDLIVGSCLQVRRAGGGRAGRTLCNVQRGLSRSRGRSIMQRVLMGSTTEAAASSSCRPVKACSAALVWTGLYARTGLHAPPCIEPP